MNVSFNKICRANVAEERSRADERVGKVIPQGGQLCQNEEHGKADEVMWKTSAKQPPRRLWGRSWQQHKPANNFALATWRHCCSNENWGCPGVHQSAASWACLLLVGLGVRPVCPACLYLLC